jgi:hypothetical protein
MTTWGSLPSNSTRQLGSVTATITSAHARFSITRRQTNATLPGPRYVLLTCVVYGMDMDTVYGRWVDLEEGTNNDSVFVSPPRARALKVSGTHSTLSSSPYVRLEPVLKAWQKSRSRLRPSLFPTGSRIQRTGSATNRGHRGTAPERTTPSSSSLGNPSQSVVTRASASHSQDPNPSSVSPETRGHTWHHANN